MRNQIEELEKREVTGHGYGTAVKMILYKYEDENGDKYTYRYAIGNGKDKGYTKISCCKSYKIKNDNINLVNYKNAISQSNACFYKAGVSTGVAAAVIALVFGGIFSGGVTMAVAALLASAYGITGSSIYNLIDSYEWGQKADTYYEAAKVSAV